MAPRRFFGKVINVHQHGETRAPLSFDLDEEQHEIQEVMSRGRTTGCPATDGSTSGFSDITGTIFVFAPLAMKPTKSTTTGACR